MRILNLGPSICLIYSVIFCNVLNYTHHGENEKDEKVCAREAVDCPEGWPVEEKQGQGGLGGGKKNKVKVRNVQQTPSAMFFKFNTQLGPPYRVLVDTNFINFAIKNKLDCFTAMMDCLLAKCIPCISDCVIAELEKLGTKHRLALRIAKDPRFNRLICTHKGTYADDCICERVRQHRCYIVATCDKDLRRRLRKVS